MNEAGELRLYHCLENSRLYREAPPQWLAIDEDEQADQVAALIQAYPAYTAVSQLPGQHLEAKVRTQPDLTLVLTADCCFLLIRDRAADVCRR